jgi:plastocyanin
MRSPKAKSAGRLMRRKKWNGQWIFILNLTAFAALTIWLALGVESRTANASSDSTIVIKMLDMPPSFQPSHITIKVGDTVKWDNVGNSVHHATSDPSHAIKPDDVANPSGAKPFDSGFLPPGQSFSHTFTVPGTYKYVCAAHEMSGMSGEIVVR